MKKIQHQSHNDWLQISGFFGLGLLTGMMVLFGAARVAWHSKFYPGITIANTPVGGLTREEAKNRIVKLSDEYQANLSFNGSTWQTPKKAILFETDATINEAYQYGRRLKIADYLLLLINRKTNFPLKISEGKTEAMELLINNIAGVVEIPPIDPSIDATGKTIKIVNGVDGVVIDSESLSKKLNETAEQLSKQKISIPTKNVSRQLTNDQTKSLQEKAEKLAQKNLTLTLDDEKIVLNGKTLVGFLNTDGESVVELEKVNQYTAGLSESLNKEPQDAKFEFEEGKVKEFAPGKDGISVLPVETAKKIEEMMINLLGSEEKSGNIQILAMRTPPKVTTEKVNELGIRERIGRGESYYQHSIPNRIYNVALASTRLNSALVAPGEEISFNKLVGEVSGATGYRQAYIISGGRTVLGDGGGLCQVSTTLFRAAMNAGLPILERWGHAYRVSYYELNSKPGVDATVIAPSKDFRFKNDTPHHILIQTINDPKTLHLVIEIYGTSDGRVATITEPKVWGNTPPLPTIYQDDPTLPVGTMKQVDWAAPGAKASFEYKVTRNGETIQEKTFTTNYQPWASVFMRGTGQ